MVIACAALAVFFWAVFIASFMKDRSRYRNCYLLVIALIATFAALTASAGEYWYVVIIITGVLFFLAVLAVPFFLFFNGVQMIRREGFGIANLLSLGFGLLIGIGELSTFLVVFSQLFIGSNEKIDRYLSEATFLNMIISVSVIYLSVSFLIFMIYCCVLQIIPRKKDFDYVIIHGAGLINGERVTKLLADRIDKAIEVYRKDPTPPVLIPSGGQGEDEKVSEAEAMAAYMIEKGIPEEKIIREDRSATTFENLRNSKEIIDAQEGSKYTALVTSNYHVYRALRYCRKVGLKCTGIGSRVAFYYWPSALIREYIAVHAERKHLIVLLLGWVICLIPIIFGSSGVIVG